MIDFEKIKTYPLRQRKNKESVKNFVVPGQKNTLDNDENIKKLAQAIVQSRQNDKPVIFQFGGHVIKTGMSLFVIDLIKQGFVTHIAGNGSVSIHDFEISYIGETSEDVANTIEDGSFGMADETGRFMNEAIKQAKIGYGHAIGQWIEDNNHQFKESSVLHAAFKHKARATIHIAIGTDIIHQHPTCDGASLGAATYYDFKLYTDTLSKLEGGVLVNIGSAVIMPEVFLKALTIARNLGYKVEEITTANLDMIDHYRPRSNVIERPTSLGGQGLSIIGKHQDTIPALYNNITKLSE